MARTASPEKRNFNEESKARLERIEQLERRVRFDRSLRERVLATHNFDRGMVEADCDRESFLFGIFVNDDNDVLLIRNTRGKKDSPGGWQVLRCETENDDGPSVQVQTVTDKSCTTREHAALLMPDGVDAIEVLNFDKTGDSINILCNHDGTFAVGDCYGEEFLPLTGIVGGDNEQPDIDRRFDEIIRTLREEGLGSVAISDVALSEVR